VAELAESEGPPQIGGGNMTLLEHLEELRQRLIRSVIAVAVGLVAGWVVAPYVLEWLIAHTVGEANVFSPVEAIAERFKLALALGIALAMPAVFWQVWSFIVPGLLQKERRLILPLVMGSMVLLIAGVAMSVFVVVPIALTALETFVTASMVVEFRLSYVLGFVYNLSLATGIVFQLPLVVAVLTLMRVISSRFLVRRWRLAIVGSVVLSALVTPGDVVVAQFLLGVPLLALYWLSVALAWTIERSRPSAGDALLDRMSTEE
jgi:sec-independent protein translocase protein TatC